MGVEDLFREVPYNPRKVDWQDNLCFHCKMEFCATRNSAWCIRCYQLMDKGNTIKIVPLGKDFSEMASGKLDPKFYTFKVNDKVIDDD